MSPNEYQELADFFVDQLGRLKQETRTFVEVSVESLRTEIRLVADGVLTNGRAIAENRRVIEANRLAIDDCRTGIEVNRSAIDDCRTGIEVNRSAIDDCRTGIEANRSAIDDCRTGIEVNRSAIQTNGGRIDALTHGVARLEASVSARFADHEKRLRALE